MGIGPFSNRGISIVGQTTFSFIRPVADGSMGGPSGAAVIGDTWFYLDTDLSLFRYTNGGVVEWIEDPIIPDVAPVNIFSNNGILYLGGLNTVSSNFELYRSGDNGDSFTMVQVLGIGFASGGILASGAGNGNTVVALIEAPNSGYFLSTDNGLTWSNVAWPGGEFRTGGSRQAARYFDAPVNGFVMTSSEYGNLFFSSDGTAPTHVDISALFGTQGVAGQAVFDGNLYLAGHNDAGEAVLGVTSSLELPLIDLSSHIYGLREAMSLASLFVFEGILYLGTNLGTWFFSEDGETFQPAGGYVGLVVPASGTVSNGVPFEFNGAMYSPLEDTLFTGAGGLLKNNGGFSVG